MLQAKTRRPEEEWANRVPHTRAFASVHDRVPVHNALAATRQGTGGWVQPAVLGYEEIVVSEYKI